MSGHGGGGGGGSKEGEIQARIGEIVSAFPIIGWLVTILMGGGGGGKKHGGH